MSIIRYWELFMPTCDFCGTHPPTEYSEEAAWAAMKREGWGTQSVPAETVRTSDQVIYATPTEEGKTTVDLCALCVREGRRYEDKPPPLFAPGAYRRYGRQIQPARGPAERARDGEEERQSATSFPAERGSEPTTPATTT